MGLVCAQRGEVGLGRGFGLSPRLPAGWCLQDCGEEGYFDLKSQWRTI